MAFSKMDYCQFLLSSQVNFTLTHLAEHLEQFSHDAMNRYLAASEMRPRHLWDKVKMTLEQHDEAFLIFDDTVLDKRYSSQIELVRRQWSGSEKRAVPGIGLVSCVYVHPMTGHFAIIDYRIYAPERDGKSKLDHVADMFRSALSRDLRFDTVLMDTWYATNDLMRLLDGEGKRFYCPIKANRLVDDSAGNAPYCKVDNLAWSIHQLQHGRMVKLKGFPQDQLLLLFRVEVSSHRTEHIVTNDLAQYSTQDARAVCAVRWKIEELHRDLKQFTGIAKCQCRKGRIQRNHIHCALLVWTRLKQEAQTRKSTVQQLKRGLLSKYLAEQLRNPSISMTRA